MKTFEQYIQEAPNWDDPRTGYPEHRGQMGKANSQFSPEERKKIHNNPKVGDVVKHGETGYYGKVAKVDQHSVHVHYKGDKYPHAHRREDHIFAHDRTHANGVRSYQAMRM